MGNHGTSKLELQGVFPILPTIFTETGEVDYQSTLNVLHWLANSGTRVVTLFGIAGEFYKLSHPEKERLVTLVVAECRRLRVQSIVSVTDHASEIAIKSATRYAELGCDCLMVLPPHFLKPGAAAVERHVTAIGRAVPDTPLLVQYAPEQSGVSISPATLARIAQEQPNVRDFKIECRPVGHYLSELIQCARENEIRCHVGNAGLNMIEAYDRGAVGVMPGASLNDVYLKIDRAYRREDRSTASRLHGLLVVFLNYIRQDVEMIISFEKTVLERRGVIRNPYCREPRFRPDSYDARLFDELLTNLLDQVSE